MAKQLIYKLSTTSSSDDIEESFFSSAEYAIKYLRMHLLKKYPFMDIYDNASIIYVALPNINAEDSKKYWLRHHMELGMGVSFKMPLPKENEYVKGRYVLLYNYLSGLTYVLDVYEMKDNINS